MKPIFRRKPVEPTVIKKKVPPYPFPVQIQTESAPLSGYMLKLTENGFLADMGAAVLKVGKETIAKFSLPAGFGSIECRVRIIKTYDTYREVRPGIKVAPAPTAEPVSTEAPTDPAIPAPAPPGNKIRIVEAHFVQVSEQITNRIGQFLQAQDNSQQKS